MIYLLFAILFGSLFSVTPKVCQRWQVDTQQVILFNYAFAFLITLVPILFRMTGPGGGFPVQDFILSKASVGACVLQGILFLAGFSIMDRCTAHCGVALTTAAAVQSLKVSSGLTWPSLAHHPPMNLETPQATAVRASAAPWAMPFRTPATPTMWSS